MQAPIAAPSEDAEEKIRQLMEVGKYSREKATEIYNLNKTDGKNVRSVGLINFNFFQCHVYVHITSQRVRVLETPNASSPRAAAAASGFSTPSISRSAASTFFASAATPSTLSSSAASPSSTTPSALVGPGGAQLTKQPSAPKLSEEDLVNVALIMKQKKVDRSQAVKIYLEQKQQK